MAAPATADPREELWNASFDTYYDSLFEEMIAADLITFWSRIDETTKVLVAITATSSAVSGWALWSHPGIGKVFWAGLSGVAAVLSIIETRLNIPSRIKMHSEDKRHFAALRTDLETFRYRMRVDREMFDVSAYTKEFVKYRSRYSDCVQKIASDIARTRGREIRIQGDVNVRLKNDIISN